MTPDSYDRFIHELVSRKAGEVDTLHVLSNCGLNLCLEVGLTNTDLPELIDDAIETLGELPADAALPYKICRCNARAFWGSPHRHSLMRSGRRIEVGSY